MPHSLNMPMLPMYLQLLEALTAQPGSDTTQRSMTTGSYHKAAMILKPLLPPSASARVLDYGSGLGLGTQAMSRVLGRTVVVDSYEPTPTKAKSAPTYTVSSQITDTYDGVVCLNVLNVLEPTLRKQVLRHLFTTLSPTGVAIIGTRKWSGDVSATKRGTPGDEPHSVWVHVATPSGVRQVYQRGFDGAELVEYVSQFVGPKYQVTRLPRIAASAVLVTPRVRTQ